MSNKVEMKMIGGLKKSTSRLAIAAATGLFVGGMALTPAQAADLGGDCCADLEERVAELEATTVRKGNRKVSVKLSGQVNYFLMYWDDGQDNDLYIVDNTESSTRFRFTGSAKFKPGWSVGFVMETEFDGANGSAVSQKRDGRGGAGENSDLTLRGRKTAWYIKSDRLGEIWMGRYSPATDDIQLLNVAGVPDTSAGQFNYGGFFLRRPQGTGGCAGTGCLINNRLGAVTRANDTRRAELIRYNTPSLGGFVFSMAWGEDDFFDVAVRYKKQWNSIQVVGGIGYYRDTDEDEDNDMVGCPDTGTLGTTGFTATNGPCRANEVDFDRWAGSGSIMHTPTGLYGYFGFVRDQFNDRSFAFSASNPLVNAAVAPIAPGRPGGDGRDQVDHYYLQAGIKRTWNQLGATTLYGEYSKWNGDSGSAGVGTSGQRYVSTASAQALNPNLNVVNTIVTDAQTNQWGFGVVQNIDKAAMQVWASVHVWDPDVDVATVVGNADGSRSVGTNLANPLEDFFFVSVGGKLKF